MIAIAPDGSDKAAEVAFDLGLTFPVVSDEGLTLTKKFGIVCQASPCPPSTS